MKSRLFSTERPPRLPRLALAIGLMLLLTFFLTRLVLTAMTGSTLVPSSLWSAVIAKALWFDFIVVLALILPIFLYEAVVPASWRRARLHLVLRWVWVCFSVFLALLLAASEIVFWMEFQTRFNFIAVDYLIYTHEVLANVWESYPVAWILVTFAGVAALAAGLMWRALRRWDSAPLSRRRNLAIGILVAATVAIALSFARLEQMEAFGNRFADELSGNGLFTFAAALRRNELEYSRFYLTMSQAAAESQLRALGVQRFRSDAGSDRPLLGPVARAGNRARNAVIISVESLSASFVGAYGNSEGLTPKLDTLISQGIKFEKLFATGTRTVRGLEALSIGTPPIPGQSIVRRPDNEHLSTIGQLLSKRQMDTFFFYGGYGYFDNMTNYFSANDYAVVDRTDIPNGSIAFENAWGVADEVLYDQVLRTLDSRAEDEKPFFAHVMTTSNHRPYTYPDGRIDIPSPGGRKGAIKYSDFALGRFIEMARAKPWFNDTIFLIVADHCASVAGKTRLPVQNYRIPGVLYAPSLLPPSVHKPVTSQIDLLPTLLDLLGQPGRDQFFGRSIFEFGPPAHRAFISNYQELGYYRDDRLTVLLPLGKVQSFRVDPQTFEATQTDNDAEHVAQAVAYYQAAAEAFRSRALRHPDFAAAIDPQDVSTR